MLNIFSFLQDVDNYESRKVDKTEVDGLIISTVYSSDEGYETAIGDANGFHPVERYESRDLSVEGHAKWVEAAPSLTTVMELGGFGGLVNGEQITLQRA